MVQKINIQRTEKLKTILECLEQNKERWYSITEIQEYCLGKYPELFECSIVMKKYYTKIKSHNQFRAYLKELSDLGIIENCWKSRMWSNGSTLKHKIKI